MQKNGWKKNLLHQKSHNPTETFSLGQEVAKQCSIGALVLLQGPMGSGKTTFAKGFISQLTGIPPEEIVSPTFQWVRSYSSPQLAGAEVHHFDLYQLTDVRQFTQKGFLDYLDPEAICCMEWADKVKPLMPKGFHQITLEHAKGNVRNILIQWG